MTLDRLLMEVRERKLLIINEAEIWPSPYVTQAIQRALRRHRQGLRVLIAWSSVDTCPSRDLHRSYWKYAGGGKYICTICQQIAC